MSPGQQEYVKLAKVEGEYEVYAHKGVLLGYFSPGVDGRYDFWPNDRGAGCWPAYILRELADKLDELNK